MCCERVRTHKLSYAFIRKWEREICSATRQLQLQKVENGARKIIALWILHKLQSRAHKKWKWNELCNANAARWMAKIYAFKMWSAAKIDTENICINARCMHSNCSNGKNLERKFWRWENWIRLEKNSRKMRGSFLHTAASSSKRAAPVKAISRSYYGKQWQTLTQTLEYLSCFCMNLEFLDFWAIFDQMF